MTPFNFLTLAAITYNTPDNHLEASYDNWAMYCTALLQILKDKDSATYLSKAKEYGAAWKLDFKQPDSTWNVVHGKGLYEGTMWQYRWSVPHDVAGIIKLAGGKETFIKQLDCFFENNLYNHANEPDIQTPFLYNSLG